MALALTLAWVLAGARWPPSLEREEKLEPATEGWESLLLTHTFPGTDAGCISTSGKHFPNSFQTPQPPAGMCSVAALSGGGVLRVQPGPRRRSAPVCCCSPQPRPESCLA